MTSQLSQYLSSMTLDMVRLCVWLVILFCIFTVIERLYFLRKEKIFRQAYPTDLAYFFINGLIPKLLIVLPLSLLTSLFHQSIPSEYYASVAALPMAVRLPVAMLIAEMGAYWGHRWSHDFKFLWRFHSIHHSAEHIDWLVNSRGHPIDLAFTRLCALVPIYLLGFAQPASQHLDLTPIYITIAGTFWGFFIHANLKWRFGWLEYLISSPAFHHWHHADDGPDMRYQNFSPMLPLVDLCFGTYHLPKHDWPKKYGTDTPVKPTLLGQLSSPFQNN